MVLCSAKPLIPLILLFIFSLQSSLSSIPTIGVTFNHPSSSDSSPEQVVSHLQRLHITAVRLPNPNPDLIRAFSYSDISLLLSIPNSDIPALAENRSNAANWVYTNIVPFYPRAHISAISVGSDFFDTQINISDTVLNAVKNVHVSLHELGIRQISVSTTFSVVSVLYSVFPPSASQFNEPINEVLIRPLLDFLDDSNSSFMINVHPFSLYRRDSEIPVGYALFQEGPFSFRDDFTTGVRYWNLYDVMIDAVVSAMAVTGHENVPVIVTQTGWPCSPGLDEGEENDASQVFAEMFLRGLIAHLRSGIGSPLMKEGPSEVYIFELFDKEENESRFGPVRQWGILYPNLTNKYKISFSGSLSSRRQVLWRCYFFMGLVPLLVVLI